MDKKQLGRLAASAMALLATQAAYSMDVKTSKGADGKTYFCANAKCSGNSECAGAGNAACGSLNKCSNTEQKYLTGWISANDKAQCEKDGMGKWMVYKPEYSAKQGNVAPLAPVGAQKAAKAAAPASDATKATPTGQPSAPDKK
jgi:hypothetical protein